MLCDPQLSQTPEDALHFVGRRVAELGQNPIKVWAVAKHGAPLRHGNLLDKHGKIHYQLQVGFNSKRNKQLEFVMVFRDVEEAVKTLGEVRRGQKGYACELYISQQLTFPFLYTALQAALL